MTDFSKLTTYLDMICEKGYTPGCDMIIRQNHHEVFRYTTGYTDREHTKKMTRDRLFYLYSCTKPITVTGAMLLVERGLLRLDDPVCKYLPEYRDAFVVENDEKITVGDTMLVRHLFTMSAGLDYCLDKAATVKLCRESPAASTRAVVATFVADPLQCRPGDAFHYSLCHDVLGAVIEVASGISFGDFLKANIFDPLGMRDTCFAKRGCVDDRMADQYLYWEQYDGLDPVTGNTNQFLLSDNYQSGGAGLIGSTADYAAFADMLACGGVTADGKRIIKEETLAEMARDQLTGFVKAPESFSCAAGEGYGYGLGVRVLLNRDAGQRSNLGEYGWDGAAGAYIAVDPKERLSIVYMQHVMNWPGILYEHKPVRDITYELLGL